MMDILKKEAQFLHYFIKLADSEKVTIAKHLTNSQITAISQILFNAIKGSFKIAKSNLLEWKRYRTSPYNNADKKTPFQQKRNLIARKRIRKVIAVFKEGLKWIPKQRHKPETMTIKKKHPRAKTKKTNF